MHKNTKLFSVLSYITWIGFLIAYLMRDKDDGTVKCHLNQALILLIVSTISGFIANHTSGILMIAANIVSLAVLILSVMGIVYAFQGSDKPLPLVGGVQLIK